MEISYAEGSFCAKAKNGRVLIGLYVYDGVKKNPEEWIELTLGDAEDLLEALEDTVSKARRQSEKAAVKEVINF